MQTALLIAALATGQFDADAGFAEDAGALIDAGLAEDAGVAADAGGTLDAGALTPVAPRALPRGFTGITGSVVDATSGEALIEATVKVVLGAKKSALTDTNGAFRLALPAGTYDLRVFYALYEGRRIQNVTVKAGEATHLALELSPQSRAIKEVVVEAKADKRNESALLQERKKAAVVSDSIGAQEIARTPDANAGDSAKRVVSVTVFDGRSVYIRGLGGRYAQTLVNGSVMPSPEPDEPSVPLDLFPTALVSNLNVIKTYSPELPAQFGGGSLTIDTSTFPTAFDVRVRASIAGDSASTFQARPSSPSSLGESLGFSDPRRALPSEITRDRPFVQSVDPSRPGITPEQQQAGGRAFSNRWTPSAVLAAPNGSVGGQIGDTLKLGSQSRLGYLAAVQWSRKELTKRTHVNEVSRTEQGLGLENPTDSITSTVSASTSALASVGLQINRDNELTFLTLATANAVNTATVASGMETLSAAQQQLNCRLQFTQRALTFNQLKGFHRVAALGDLELEWQANYSHVARNEPDIRDTRYFVDPDTGGLNLRFQPNSAERFFLELNEESGGGTVSASLPWRAAKFKVGAVTQYSTRLFDGRRFRYFDVSRPARSGYADSLLVPSAIGPGAGTRYILEEDTFSQDRYASTLLIYGGFAQAEWHPTAWFRGVAGVRYEGSTQTLSSNSPYATQLNTIASVNKHYDNPVPSVNLTFSPWAAANLRAAYATTLARPTFRELGPFVFFDMIRRTDTSGNPSLEQTTIHHGDLRAEWFPSENEVFGVSVFGKQFVKPIERVVISQASNYNFGFRNADGATLLGVELEGRTSLGRLSEALKELRVGANGSLMWSKVDLTNTTGQLGSSNRPLQGQAPWVANAFVTWSKPEWGTEVGLFYNVAGPRITEVAVADLPNFIEQPFHKLDVTISQKLGSGFLLKLSAANVLNQVIRINQSDVEVFRYAPGVQANASLTWAMPTPERK